MEQVQIFHPPVADMEQALDYWLIEITRRIDAIDPESVSHGMLGGEYGYGASFENDSFVMRPQYWGDCDCGFDAREHAWNSENHHSETCYQAELQSAKKIAGLSYTDIASHSYVMAGQSFTFKEEQNLSDEIYNRLLAKYKLPRTGCAVHCTCGMQEAWMDWVKANGHLPTCSLELPNFKHKKTGFEVRWYKWIGRDMQYEPGFDLNSIFKECLSSLANVD